MMGMRMHSPKLGIMVAACCLVAMLGGCRTWTPLPSDFIENYWSLRPRPDSSLHCYDAPTSSSLAPRVVCLRNVEWRAGDVIPQAGRRELAHLLRARFRKHLLRNRPPDVLVVKDMAELAQYAEAWPGGSMTVDLAITHADKGHGLLRYFVGFGLGDAKVQVELQARRPAYADGPVHEAAALGRSHGNTVFGPNPSTLFSPQPLRLAVDGASQQLAEHLCERLRPPE
ncbi:hypothetical protein ACFL34_02875 [Candidatus Sumerlaeota bacterium]